MEGIGLDGERRMRPVLCRAVHAGGEPHGDRLMTRDYPRIVVPPPGPKARAIVERQDRWASTSYPKEYPLAVARGQGAMVEDVDGNRFLDFMAGIPPASSGYRHPQDLHASQEAASQFLHIFGNHLFHYNSAPFFYRPPPPPPRTPPTHPSLP